jgi:hypothetical protein
MSAVEQPDTLANMGKSSASASWTATTLCIICIGCMAAAVYSLKTEPDVRTLTAFLALGLAVVCCTYPIMSRTTDTFILSSCWAAWLLLSLVTHESSSSWTTSLIAHVMAVAGILTTYITFVRTSKVMVLLIVLGCVASVMFPAISATNAYKTGLWDMMLHVVLFTSAFVVTEVFDKFNRDKDTTRPLRCLRCGWVLFVENELLFFLVPQLLLVLMRFWHNVEEALLIARGGGSSNSMALESVITGPTAEPKPAGILSAKRQKKRHGSVTDKPAGGKSFAASTTKQLSSIGKSSSDEDFGNDNGGSRRRKGASSDKEEKPPDS